MYNDAWDSEVTIVNNFIQYRMRSLDLYAVSELKVKGKRLYINHFKENVSQPRMCIICKNHDDALEMYNAIHEQFENTLYTPTSPSFWSYFCCSRS